MTARWSRSGPAFSDNILAHIKTMNRPQMATVRYKEFQEAQLREDAVIRIEKLPPYVTESKGVRIEDIASIGEVDITDAEVVVAGGRGIRKEEDLQLLQELADVLGGQVGVSRALVDAGMAASSIQIGYSGNRVKPKVYIACGISGAPQHLAGMKESDLIIAINSDPSAPIFQVSDYGFGRRSLRDRSQADRGIEKRSFQKGQVVDHEISSDYKRSCRPSDSGGGRRFRHHRQGTDGILPVR